MINVMKINKNIASLVSIHLLNSFHLFCGVTNLSLSSGVNAFETFFDLHFEWHSKKIYVVVLIKAH